MKNYLLVLFIIWSSCLNSFGQTLRISTSANNLNIKHSGDITCNVNLKEGKIISSGTIILGGSTQVFEDMHIECKKLEINSATSFSFKNTTIKCDELILNSSTLNLEGLNAKCEQGLKINSSVTTIFVTDKSTINASSVFLTGGNLTIKKNIDTLQEAILLIKYNIGLTNGRTIVVDTYDNYLTFKLEK
ncbi:hypothetical protein [Runella zeae]|uniref:hypothetical protein n=1 Tax=Runella zeae TaxID=94255 RepID=UPI002355A3A0|nr:hypothetical protein [Runella zeae]